MTAWRFFASDPCVEATLNYIQKQKEYERTQHISTHPLFHAKHDHRHFKFVMFQNSTIYDLYTFWKPNLGAIPETKTPFPGLHMRAFWESHQAVKLQKHSTHTYVLVLKLVLHNSQMEDLKKKNMWLFQTYTEFTSGSNCGLMCSLSSAQKKLKRSRPARSPREPCPQLRGVGNWESQQSGPLHSASVVSVNMVQTQAIVS